MNQQLHDVNDAVSGLSGFTGVALHDACGPITVYASSVSSTLVNQATQHAAPSDLDFKAVANSLTALNKVQDEITREFDALQGQGFQIVAYWPDMINGYEKITLTSATAAQVAYLTSHFGPAVQVGTDANTYTAMADRQSDSSPFKSGDFIMNLRTDGLVANCTSGAGIHFGSGLTENYLVMTAGHCSTSGTGASAQPSTGNAFQNAYYDNSGTHGSQLLMGTVNVNAWNSNYDVSVIAPPAGIKSSPYVWVGGTPTASTYYQLGPRRALVGDVVCTDGAYEGARCAGKVDSTHYLGCISLAIAHGATPHSICSVIEAGATSVIVGEGDSGGPVYANIAAPPGVYMDGIISYGVNGTLACPLHTDRGNVCANRVGFTDLQTALTKTGYQLTTNTNP